MKMVSVFNDKRDEIRIPADMLDYYQARGWKVDSGTQEKEVEEFE